MISFSFGSVGRSDWSCCFFFILLFGFTRFKMRIKHNLQSIVTTYYVWLRGMSKKKWRNLRSEMISNLDSRFYIMNVNKKIDSLFFFSSVLCTEIRTSDVCVPFFSLSLLSFHRVVTTLICPLQVSSALRSFSIFCLISSSAVNC